MDAVTYFHNALVAGLSPCLLEFTHPHHKTPLTICGINPVEILEVVDGILYKNGECVGHALDIFDYLKIESGDNFFPAYLGYFSYEFADYFHKPCHHGQRQFPDAYFCRYGEGLFVDNGVVRMHTSIPTISSFSPRSVTLSQELKPGCTFEEFSDSVASIKKRITSGHVYQVNYSLPFYFDLSDNSDDVDQMMLDIYRAMRQYNHSPYMGIMKFHDRWILSGSPERLFSYSHGRVTARPIAGTIKRGDNFHDDDAQIMTLTSSSKENSEHVMLVDLVTNDLNQIAKPGTVIVDEDRTVEFYSHVCHLVSELSGESNASLKDIFRANFPGGTITGAPKLSVMTAIAELEHEPRGPYTGSLGYCSSDGNIDFNILIRSIYQHDDKARINAGAGIVIDSDHESEWKEVHSKAEAVREILRGHVHVKIPRAPLRGPRVIPSQSNCLSPSTARILFIENNDSFSWNIINAFKSTGAELTLASLPYSSSSLTFANFSHVVIGPGPGSPEEMPALRAVLDNSIAHKIPTLGICLGHQAIGWHFGAAIRNLPEPIHGKTFAIHHQANGLFRHLSSPLSMTRYHSLAVATAPANFSVDAYSEDDCIMAIRHHHLPIFGLQFHPESYTSHNGMLLLRAFLEVT